MSICCFYIFFFFKQKTAYEMRISDWSSDVCSSDLRDELGLDQTRVTRNKRGFIEVDEDFRTQEPSIFAVGDVIGRVQLTPVALAEGTAVARQLFQPGACRKLDRSEEHTSELQSLMRNSYAGFCLKKKHRETA